MSITRTPVCRTKGCPAPRDPDWHVPWCGHGTEGHHHHVPKRSQGGKNIVAFLCPACHDKVDNTPDWDNDISPGEDGKLEYILWDTQVEGGWNHPLIRRTLEAGSAAAEGACSSKEERLVDSQEHVGSNPTRPLNSAAAPSASGKKEEDDGERLAGHSGAGPPPHFDGVGGDASGGPVRSAADIAGGPALASGGSGAAEGERVALHGPPFTPSAAPPSLETFSLETWQEEGKRLVEMGHALKDATSMWQFTVGDWFVRGENALGEEVYGHIDWVGFSGVALRQYAWVAAKVGPDTRVLARSWTYCRAVAALPEPKQKEWLKRAQEENLSSKDLSQAINPPKSKPVYGCAHCDFEGTLDLFRRVT